MDNLLILEKSVFDGTAKDKLIKFIKCHDVVLPYSLHVECAISKKGGQGIISGNAQV